MTSISDPRSANWITSYAYNANNQLLRQQQPDALGQSGLASPVTRLYYDKLGQQVAIRDAMGNLTGKVYDGGGNLVEEVHADGGTVGTTWDALGNLVMVVAGNGNNEDNRLMVNDAAGHVLLKVQGNITPPHLPTDLPRPSVRTHALVVNGAAATKANT